jgi:hypothetical protein
MPEDRAAKWQLKVDFLKERLACDQVDNVPMCGTLAIRGQAAEFQDLFGNER